MNPLASPPYSTDNVSLASSYSPPLAEPTMRAILASTAQILDTPPPPSLREILSAYKARGDGDREMLLSMLQAKSAEDSRIAAHMSLQRTVIDLHYRIQDPDASPEPAPAQLLYGSSSQHIPQISLPPQQHHPSHHSSSNTRSHHHRTNAYSPPAHTSHQAAYSPPPDSHARLHERESPISSPNLRLPSIRSHGHAGVSAERERDRDTHRERERDRDRDSYRLRAERDHERERTAENRRKRARVGDSSVPSSSYESRRHGGGSTHYTSQYLADPRPATGSSLHDLPPSPYSTSSHRSLSTDSTHSHSAHATSSYAPAGSLVSASAIAPAATNANGASSSKVSSDESWVRESDRMDQRDPREIDADLSEDDVVAAPVPSKSARRTSRDSLHQHTSSARTHMSYSKPAPSSRS